MIFSARPRAPMNIFANRVSVGSRVVFPLVKFTRKMVPVYPYSLFYLRESFFELSRVCLRARTSRHGIIFILQGVVRAELYTLRITRAHVALEDAAGCGIIHCATKWAGHCAHTTADAAGCASHSTRLSGLGRCMAPVGQTVIQAALSHCWHIIGTEMLSRSQLNTWTRDARGRNSP
jgi:hypothetical protein